MWDLIATNSGVVLGLAISAYTIYSYVEARAIRKRRQYAFLHYLYQELSYFTGLAAHVGRRADQVREVYKEHLRGSFPNPAAEKDELPPEVDAHSKWLVQRATHLIEYDIPLDIEKLGAMLNKSQIGELLEVMTARRVYLQVLATRAMDLEAFPRKPGVLARFVAVAQLNVPEMNKKLSEFASTLGLSSPEL